jgi:hypothetical protein
MNQKRRVHFWPAFLIAALILAAGACEKKKAAPVEEVAPMDRVAPARVEGTQTVLQETFVVKSSKTFPFEIPAHAVRPHLHGIFASFIREVHVASDDSANVDFLILNADQYGDFVANRPSEALFSIEASHNQSVNFDLPASLDQPAKYYLIFRNAAHSHPSAVVEANFRVDF